MADLQLNKLWTAISVFIVVFSIDSWLRTQGIEPLLGARLPHEQRAASALFGVIVTCGAILFQIYIANVYSSRQPAHGFFQRYPIAFFVSLDPSKREARVYQRFMYLIMNIVPLCAVGHFLSIILKSKYFIRSDCRSGANLQPRGVWEWPEEYVLDDGFRLGDCDGLTFFPVVEPAMIVLLCASCLVFNCFYLTKFGRKKRTE